MCILMYFGPDAMPIEEHLSNGCDNNPDGFGWAVVVYSENRIITGHSMVKRVAIDEFLATRKLYPHDSAIFHARIATAGSVNIDNCHPFKVNGRENMVLAHNGILPVSCQPVKGDDRSDTRVLADGMFLSRWGGFDDPTHGVKATASFESWLGTGSKVVVLTTDRRYSFQSYIFNEKLGFWLDEKDGHDPSSGDIWYSNTSHCKRTYSWAGSRSYSTGLTWWEDAESSTIGYPTYTMGCRTCRFVAAICPCSPDEKNLYYGSAAFFMDEINNPSNPDSWHCNECGMTGWIDIATLQCEECQHCFICGRHECADCGLEVAESKLPGKVLADLIDSSADIRAVESLYAITDGREAL